MVATLELLKMLCADVNYSVTVQASELRNQFALELDQILALQLCPDWPPQRVQEFAQRRRVWRACDVVADAFRKQLPASDAVWLLLQPGVLNYLAHLTFVTRCAERAKGYAEQLLGASLTPAPADLAACERQLRQLAVERTQERPSPDSGDTWRIYRASRIAGLAEQVRLGGCASAKLALKVSGLCYQVCPQGAPAEVELQLRHLGELTGYEH